jgi:hypothetical protein
LVATSVGGRAIPAERASWRGGRAVGGAVASAILPPLAIVGFTALVFFGELAGGAMAYGRDTTVFYYPLTEWMVGELRQGRLPLWIPLIFGGYPLLADGEVGPLYLPHLPLLLTLPTPLAYVWARALHYAVAALGLYALARTLGTGGLGGLIGGLAFAYGSFMIGHLEHDNILRSAAWLPWLLFGAERALRAGGPRRVLWAVFGAMILALQATGVHIQPLLLSLLVLGAYVLVGPLGQEAGGGRRETGNVFAGLLPRLRLGVGIVGLGLGLAAAQLLPLFLLGQQSMRPGLVTYVYATSYAVSPPQLLTLLFPYMFHFDVDRSWALWGTHETTLYSGVAPLVLALVALGFARGRAVLFFGAIGLVSLLLCLGDYLPVKLYSVIWNLPGFAYLRAPARFALLFQFALACLAALGTDWIARRARVGVEAGNGSPQGAARFLVGLAASAGVLAVAIQAGRWVIQQEPSPLLETFRMLLQTSKENWLLGPWHVYYGLLEFSRPDNGRTALSISLLAATPLVLRGWLAHPSRPAAWGAALAALVAADLWLFVTAFHHRAPPDRLGPSSPATAALTSYAQTGGEPFRLFVEPELNRSFGPNQLVRSGLATLNGYSSLEPRRSSEYWWGVVAHDNVLLDLFNIRYVLATHRTAGQRAYQAVAYHPSDRLMSGAAGSPAGSEEFRVAAVRVEGVTAVAAVEGLPAGTAAGTPVAEVVLHGSDGEQRTVPLRAGVELAEYLAETPGRPTAEYAGPPVVWAESTFVPYGTGRPARLYGATVAVDPPLEVVGVTARALPSAGRLHLHGLGLRDATGRVSSLRSIDKAKYRAVYGDQEMLLLENARAWPRAFVVGGAVGVDPGTSVVEQMLERRWDPTREAMLEGVGPTDVRAAPEGGPVGRAEVLTYEPSRVVVEAHLDALGYLVLADRFADGWRARIGDDSARSGERPGQGQARELPIHRANAIQRAVELPAGDHVVTFSYEPWWVTLGFALSGLAALAAAATVAVALVRRRA